MTNSSWYLENSSSLIESCSMSYSVIGSKLGIPPPISLEMWFNLRWRGWFGKCQQSLGELLERLGQRTLELGAKMAEGNGKDALNELDGCEECRDVVEVSDGPHVIRTCESCGRELRIREPGEDGKGIRIREGDRFVIPKGFIKLAFDPRKARGRLFRPGVTILAEMLFLKSPELRADTAPQELSDAYKAAADEVVDNSAMLEPFDLESKDDSEEAIALLKQNPQSPEFYALMLGAAASGLVDAVAEQDVQKGIMFASLAERAKTMLRFKTHMEEPLWMAQSTGNLVQLFRIWQRNADNADEEFWHQTFSEHPFLLAQALAVPVVIIEDKAYVGGHRLDNTGAKLLDFLCSAELSRDVVLVEIKTPKTQLVQTSEYRSGVHAPSSKLSGAVVQVQEYRRTLGHRFPSLQGTADEPIEWYQPRCVVVAGTAAELDGDRRSSFELFRGGLKDVEVLCYDELFRKIALLLEVLGQRPDGRDESE